MKLERSIEVYCDNCGEPLGIVAEGSVIEDRTNVEGNARMDRTTRIALRVERCECEDGNIAQRARKGKR